MMHDYQNQDRAHAEYRSCNFWGSNMKEANFRHATFIDCNLDNTDLRGADFSHTKFHNVTFFGARYDLSTRWPKGFNYLIQDAIGPDAEFDGVDFRLFPIAGMDLCRCIFSYCDLKNTSLRGCDIRGANFSSALLNGADFTNAIYGEYTVWPEGFEYTNLGAIGVGSNNPPKDMRPHNINYLDTKDCNWTNATFEGMHIFSFHATDCDLRGSNFNHTKLYDVNFSRCKLQGATFKNSFVQDFNVEDAIYDEHTVWPEGFDYKNSGAIGPYAILQDTNKNIVLESPSNLNHVIFKGCDRDFSDTMKNLILRYSDKRDLYRCTNQLSISFNSYLNRQQSTITDQSPAYSMKHAHFENMLWKGTFEGDASYSTLQNVFIESLENVNMQYSKLRNIFIEHLTSVQFQHAHLVNVNFERSILDNVQFEHAQLEGCSFKNAIYTETTTWPKGFDYKNSGAIGTGAIFNKKEWSNVSICGNINLQKIQMKDASIRDSHIRKADMRHGNFHKINVQYTEFFNVDMRHGNLRKSTFERVRFDEVDMRCVDLRGADLRDIHFSECLFDGAIYDEYTLWPEDFAYRESGAIGPYAHAHFINLTQLAQCGVSLHKLFFPAANLEGIALRGKILSSANLYKSNLKNADFRDSILMGANLKKSDLRGCNLKGANLANAELKGATYDESTIWPVGFLYTQQEMFGPYGDLSDKRWNDRTIRDIDLHHSVWTGSILRRVTFRSCSLSHASFHNASLVECRFVEADLRHANFQNADLRRADLRGADLRGANLDGADLIGCCLNDALVDEHTIWPSSHCAK